MSAVGVMRKQTIGCFGVGRLVFRKRYSSFSGCSGVRDAS